MSTVKFQIGEFIFDDTTDCFETSLTSLGKDHPISICDVEKEDFDSATILGFKLKHWLEGNLDNAKDYAASKLLALKNEHWLEPRQKALSRSDFVAAMDFDGVNGFSDGGFEIYFVDGDLFFGHTIVVDVTETFEFEDARIVG